jgi:RNA polymerase sigma-70 factor (ECF subfamily)
MPSNAGKQGFPETRWSLVLRAGGEPTEDSRKALSELCRSYQAPLRAFARRIELDRERAEEVLQSFFLRAVEKDVVGAADQDRGRFRAFLCSALRHHAINHHRHENRVSNGGGAPHVDVQDVSLESGEPPTDLLFDRLWARELMIQVLARLGEEETRAGRGALFQVLRERLADVGDRPLRQLAAELHLSAVNLRVKLHRLRSRFIALARAEVAETVARPEDVDAELSTLLAAWSDDQ